MLPFLAESSGLERLFLVCAILGGLLFIVRLVLQFMGGDAAGHHDISSAMDAAHADMGDASFHDAGTDFQDADANIHDSYLSFKILSFQGLTAFFMMFGLVGLAMMKQTGQGPVPSLFAAVAAGAGTVWVIGLIFREAGSLQTSGNIDLRNAIGQEGEIYLTIPSSGTGKARVTVQERSRIYDAVSTSKEQIKTGQRIRVVDVTAQDVLVVERIE